jgi:hypothetical protein
MRTAYEIRSGQRVASRESATTTYEALIGYLRGQGCRDAEITRIGAAAVVWRGAVYRACAETFTSGR